MDSCSLSYLLELELNCLASSRRGVVQVAAHANTRKHCNFEKQKYLLLETQRVIVLLVKVLWMGHFTHQDTQRSCATRELDRSTTHAALLLQHARVCIVLPNDTCERGNQCNSQRLLHSSVVTSCRTQHTDFENCATDCLAGSIESGALQ